MKPQTPPDFPTDDLFRHRLENLMDMRHQLVKLAELIDELLSNVVFARLNQAAI